MEMVPLVDVQDVVLFQPPPAVPAPCPLEAEIDNAIAMQIITETDAISERAQSWVGCERERERLEHDLAAREDQERAWALSCPTPPAYLSPTPASDYEIERALNDEERIEEQRQVEDGQLRQQMVAQQEQLEAEEDRGIIEQMVKTQEEAEAHAEVARQKDEVEGSQTPPCEQPTPPEGSPRRPGDLLPLTDGEAVPPLSATQPVKKRRGETFVA